MCFLARLVLPSERIVSAEKLGGARGPGLQGQARVGSGVRSGLGTWGASGRFPGPPSSGRVGCLLVRLLRKTPRKSRD